MKPIFHGTGIFTPKKRKIMKNEETQKIIMTASYKNIIKDDLLNAAYSLWIESHDDQLFFEHKQKTYWYEIDTYKLNQELTNNKKKSEPRIDSTGFNFDDFITFSRYCKISEIGNFIIDFLYFQRDSITEESFYFCQISNQYSTTKIAITPKALASNSDFKPTIMSVLSGAIFTGNTIQLNSIFKEKTQGLKSIETIPYIGYNKKREAYIYEEYAVKNGVIYEKNDNGYFELSNHLNIKSTLNIPSFEPSIFYKNQWLDDFLITFEEKGLIALCFWVGSLFIEQIRDKGHPWPFLTITGQAGAGKSFLIEFLWKLFGRDQYEGENPSSASASARSRYLLQVSNLPVVFIEGDIDDPNNPSTYKQKGFNFEELKAMFNGRSPRMTAYKTTDNTINNQGFKGGLVISQNKAIEGSEAIESRLIDLYFDKSHHTKKSYLSANKLSQLDTKEVSGFLFHALKQEKRALEIIDQDFATFRLSINQTLGKSSNSRIETTHGLMLSYLKFLGEILPISQETLRSTSDLIHELSLNKTQNTTKEPSCVSQFWDVYEYLFNNAHQKFNHTKNPTQIAICLNDFYPLATRHLQDLPDIKQLQKILHLSTRHKFVAYKPMRSAISGKTSRCYIFEKGNEDL